MRYYILLAVVFALTGFVAHYAEAAPEDAWTHEWPRTDFSKTEIDFDDVISGGPPKDGIPAIDDPRFDPVHAASDLGAQEPVIAVTQDGKAKAYPLRILMWHEIVNDKIGDVPITVTYCPLCNTSVVFDRRLDGRVLDFGVTGKLRHSDMLMYDRQTESWWQQFLGYAVVGALTGAELTIIPSQVVPFAQFKKEHPRGMVLQKPLFTARAYGQNPYRQYDSSRSPFLYKGDYDRDIPAMAYVVAVGGEAWPLASLRAKGEITHGDIILRWQAGMSSALDADTLAGGRDIGFVTVTDTETGEAVAHLVTFAFAFDAFHPDGIIYQ